MSTTKLQEWLEDGGIKDLNWLQLEDFPDTGRGVKTLRPLKLNDVVLTIPGSYLWTVDAAFDDPLLGPAIRSIKQPLSVEDTLAVFLLFVKSREEDYEGRRAHVNLLPSSYTTSVFFNDSELEACSGSSLYQLTKQLKQQMKEDYLQLVNDLFSKHPDLFPLEKFTLDEYMWAINTIWSRGMDFQLPGKQFRCIAPFADMLNHSPEVQLCHIYDPQLNNLQIFAGKDYAIGEQVFINYGSVPNNRLLRLYGFIFPNNPYDSYDLVLTTHPLAPLYSQKVALLESAGLKVDETFSLKLSDPLPLDVLRYLRIQRLSSSEISTAEVKRGASNIISARNEAEILNALIEACEGLLAGFGTPLEELEAKVSSGEYKKGDNIWAAALVSVGEQRILKTTLHNAKELLALVICAQCGKANEDNKRCGRCRKVVYCGTDCQRSHYKEHKALCRKYATEGQQ
ncbi:2001_t:CDS:2 [Funneliformis geosporum]|uniref:10319_t:CDS:1 n=1 Tax=Funneliformis geosporum TaxID=1117311 RepID=A0A9W4SWW9_9GLOM|nr:2001_t:CDS:2 [Funneliformis geosporum]CAI2186417.1 10319_t:CDS:2 [Funneliformis geosporum]